MLSRHSCVGADVAVPLLGDRGAPGEGHASVDHDGAAVGATVDPDEVPQGERPEALHRDARVAQLVAMPPFAT